MTEPNTPITTVMDRLVRQFPHAKKTTLREMLSDKRVRINGEVAKSLKHPVLDSDKFEVVDLSAAPAKKTVLAHGLKIIHLDNDVIIVNKPAGMLTSTGPDERRPTALKILTAYFQGQNSKLQVHLIHRLDRDASGLLVFARNANALRNLKVQFFEHTIDRHYDVLVHGIPNPKEGKLEDYLLEDEQTGLVGRTKDMKKGKLAILNYTVLDSNEKKNIAHLRCELFTGRKHQIRVQLDAIGHGVLADPRYGPSRIEREEVRKTWRPAAKRKSPAFLKEGEPGGPMEEDENPFAARPAPGRLGLHASKIAFDHPTGGKRVSFESVMPGNFSSLFH